MNVAWKWRKTMKTAIKDLRIASGMSQAELAEKTGVSNSTIWMIEQGKRTPSFPMAEKFCQVFDVNLSQLFGEENIKHLMPMKLLPGLREEKALTQEGLAEAIGVDIDTVTAWESGRRYPSYNALKALSNFFDVSLEYLEGTTDERDPLFSGKLDDNYRRAYVKGETEMRDTVIAAIIGMQNDLFPESREYAVLQKLFLWIKNNYGGMFEESKSLEPLVKGGKPDA